MDENSKSDAGAIKSHNTLPTAEMMHDAGTMDILDRQGKKLQLRDVYDGPAASQNVMVIFIRHFYCTVHANLLLLSLSCLSSPSLYTMC